MLLVSVRRYRCSGCGCGHVWRQDPSKAAQPRAKLSRRGLRWALEGIVCEHLMVARIAEGLGMCCNTANKAVLAEGRRVLIDDPNRFDGGWPSSVLMSMCGGKPPARTSTSPLSLTSPRSATGPARPACWT
jgi:hypothetical protein